MTPEQLAAIKSNDDLRKRMAKWMAHDCFRNTGELEDMHAAGRISQDEMKRLMIDVVNRSYLFLSVLFTTQRSNEIIEILKHGKYLPPDWKDWNNPQPMIRRHLYRG
jgi:hypothetical protein